MPKVGSKLNAVIVDPDVNRRLRLKQGTVVVGDFADVYSFSTLEESLKRLDYRGHCEAVFLSHSFGKNVVSDFIRIAKSTRQGQDSAYILMLSANERDGSGIAGALLGGVDGFLMEPFSLDALIQVTALARKITAQRRGERYRAAISLLLDDAVRYVDQLAINKAIEREPGKALKELRAINAKLVEFEQEAEEIYFDMLVDRFQRVPIPRPLFEDVKYKGTSRRVKKKEAARALKMKESQSE